MRGDHEVTWCIASTRRWELALCAIDQLPSYLTFMRPVTVSASLTK